MGDFTAFSEDIDAGMEFLEHHGILGQRWGKLNGPPYPLGIGDHSSSEKSAAKAAGVSVGSDSGKGSIDNVKKSKSKAGVQNKPKKELTEEEKREKALEAARSGDKKKLAKYMDYLSTEELRDAQTRAQAKDQFTRKDPSEQKASKAEMEKQEAIRSGDKEKVKQYADQMSYQELSEAMNKIDLTTKLNYVVPPKSAMDKLSDAMNKVDQFRSAAEKGINAYNLAAKVYNSTHKDGPQWPVIENQQQKKDSKETDVAKKLLDQATKDVAKGVQQTQQQNQDKQKSYKEKKKEELENKKMDYEYQKKYDDWVKEQEKGKKTQQELETKLDEAAEKAYKEVSKKIKDDPENMEYENSSNEITNKAKRRYEAERAPQISNVNFNAKVSKDFDDKSIWNSVEEASSNSRPISDDLTPAEEAFLNSFRRN